MEFTPQNLCGFLIRSRLMTPDEMQAMNQRWQSEARKDAGNLSQFINWLVTNQFVTEYQAKLLAKGHGEPAAYFLNQYKIMERVGRGRMAGVYRAVHALGQVVAIKVLPPSRAENPHTLARFQREARLALRLQHPNVVRTFQVGQANDLYYLVMELLEGETLEETLQRRKRLPPGEAVRLVHQALTGLQHIHELGLVHRDLKPANLMLVPAPVKEKPDTTAEATLKILDIGLGRQLFEEESSEGADRLDLTMTGVILGTPDYLVPEQASDARTIDIRADIYSLGGVLYHLLTGQPPFPDTNLIKQMVRHATETPKPLRQFNPAIPDGLQQIINYMLAKDPGQRYATPERASQALQMFLLADSQASASLEEPPQMRKFLTWLDTAPDANAASESQDPPLAKPVKAAARLANSAHPLTGRPGSHQKKHKRHKRAKPAADHRVQPARLANAEDFDVELVADTREHHSLAAPPGQKVLGLTKREWKILGAGTGTVLLLIGIVALAVLLLR